MATLRKFKCYRHITRAWTRKSKFKRKSYVKAVPVSKVIRYDMGDPKKTFKYSMDLICNEPMQVRHNALESARQVGNRRLEANLGRSGYYFKLRKYPHHVLRENKMLVGAGADRMQTGMQLSYGKSAGKAAILKNNSKIFEIYLSSERFVPLSRKVLKQVNSKLPGKTKIVYDKVPSKKKESDSKKA